MNWVRWLFLFTVLPLALAVITGAISLSYFSLLPASVLAFSLLFEPPSGFSVERSFSRTSLRVGEEVEVRVKLRVDRGVGAVVVQEIFSPALRVVEGSNKHVFFKRPGEKLDVEYSYRLRALKRGQHRISPVEVEGHHFLGLEGSNYALLLDEVTLKVSPRVPGIKRAVLRNVRGKPGTPPVAVTNLGFSSTEFREVREYRAGDPLRAINWKATARLNTPLVNEYEREGFLTVMFYLDASSSMMVGGLEENALETAVASLIPLVLHLLRRGYRVGLYILGHETLLTPVSGYASASTFTRTLTSVGISPKEESLPLAVERTRKVLRGALPVVITNLRRDNFSEIKEGMERLYSLTKNIPILMDVDVYPNLEFGELISTCKKGLREELRFPAIKLSENENGAVLQFLGVVR